MLALLAKQCICLRQAFPAPDSKFTSLTFSEAALPVQSWEHRWGHLPLFSAEQHHSWTPPSALQSPPFHLSHACRAEPQPCTPFQAAGRFWKCPTTPKRLAVGHSCAATPRSLPCPGVAGTRGADGRGSERLRLPRA